MSLNARLMGRILSVQKILVGGIEQTPEGAVTDGKVTPYILIRGSTGNDAIVDSNGNLVCMLKGDQNLPIAQDASGNMVAVIKGSEDLIIAQDTSGNMIAAMKGLEGANVRDIAVDENGNMVTLMKGDDGTNLQTVKVDASGQMYVAMTGQSLSVDNHPSDYFKADESAVVKGDDGGTKRLIAVDTSGIMLSRMKGAYGAVLKDILLDDTGIMLSRMKGSFGGALKDIGVDTDGNMISVMKGDYGGVLDTVALDDHGRMLSIVTDPEDVWGKSHGIGMAEAVARLGSHMRFERRGNVMFVDDFESSTLKYNDYTSGSPNNVARCTDTALTGDFSVKCVTGANTNHHAGISYTMNNYHVSKVGAEISFATSDAKVDMMLSMVYNTDNKYYRASLKFDNYTNLLYYLDDANAWQNAVPSSLWYERGIRSWATMKLVIDLSTKKYVRGFVTRDESDLSAYGIFNAVDANDFLTINAYVSPSENVAKTAYLDNFVLTENEPV